MTLPPTDMTAWTALLLCALRADDLELVDAILEYLS
jgi:hypothetical protein